MEDPVTNEVLRRRITESLQLISNEFTHDLEQLFSPSNVAKLSNNIIQFFKSENDFPPPPYTDEEILPDYTRIFQPFEDLLEQTQNPQSSRQIGQYLMNMKISEILVLMGQRITPASIRDSRAIPPNHDKLIQSASDMYNDKLNIGARSLSKHAYRCVDNYWGKIEGPPSEQNEYAIKVIDKLLIKHTWWNVFGHFKHESVFEIRDKTGHGARWSMDNIFIGFVEARDPNSGLSFRSN